jgi:hypothetical protein
LSTTNPTCCPGANPGRRGGKPASNRLSYGTALSCVISTFLIIIIIIIIIIINGKIALLEPQHSLEDSARLHPVFTPFDFVTLIFLQSKVVGLESKPQP